MSGGERFVSYGQNHEDVVLHRALAGLKHGTYVEVGANHPQIDSISRSFYDRGWRGLAIEPNPKFAALFRNERPGDLVLEAAVTDSEEPFLTFHVIEGTGLSTLIDSISNRHAAEGYPVTDLTVQTTTLTAAIENAHLASTEIQFLVIDAEGAESQVIRSLDLERIRPWILVIEATEPRESTPSHLSWESLVLDGNYLFCQFDGLSRFYVAAERADELGQILSVPANVLDEYDTDSEARLRKELETALERAEYAERLNEGLRQTVSWRVTRPLRTVRRLLRDSSGRDG